MSIDHRTPASRDERLGATPGTRLPVDHTLHVLVAVDERTSREVSWLVDEAVAGGATVIQLRAKRSTTRHFLAIAADVRRALEGTTVPLIVNDRVDVALAAGAHGVHLGRNDLAPDMARRLLTRFAGDAAEVGVTLTSEQRDMPEPPSAATYAGIGPVFPTTSKADAPPPTGLAVFRRIVQRCPVPAVAIGGVTAERVPALVAAGVVGVAVISAVCDARNPRAAAAELVARVHRAREARKP